MMLFGQGNWGKMGGGPRRWKVKKGGESLKGRAGPHRSFAGRLENAAKHF